MVFYFHRRCWYVLKIPVCRSILKIPLRLSLRISINRNLIQLILGFLCHEQIWRFYKLETVVISTILGTINLLILQFATRPCLDLIVINARKSFNILLSQEGIIVIRITCSRATSFRRWINRIIRQFLFLGRSTKLDRLSWIIAILFNWICIENLLFNLVHVGYSLTTAFKLL